MKKIFLSIVSALVAVPVWSQTVPPDYPSQVAGSVDQQIEMVRRNYEDVEAKAKKKLAKEKAAKIAAQKRVQAQKEALRKKAEAKAEKLEKREDERAELEMELKRLEVRKAQSKARLEEAVDLEMINRVKEVVDARLKK